LHPNERLVREFHEAQRVFYAGGAVEPLLEYLAEDIVWHVPGRNAIAGDHTGLDEVVAYFERRRALADATLRVIVRAVLANDELVMQLADGIAERGGRTFDWRTVGVFRIAGRRITECWLVPFDQYAFDEAWSRG
jgi:ketosteroid isomerase-like protein